MDYRLLTINLKKIMESKVIHFTEIIKKMPPKQSGAWHYVDVDEDIEAIFGRKGFIWIKGFINQKPFQSTLFPKGGGQHAMTISLKLQKELGVKLHDEITVSLEENFEEIIAEMPIELQEALDFDDEMNDLFGKLSASNQKYYKIWIGGGKHIETRINRVVTLFERLQKNVY